MQRGDLVLVGGAEILQRKPIIRRFVELAGGPEGRFAVLASATTRPLENFSRFREWLAEAGVDPGHVELLAVSRFLPGMEGGAHAAAVVERIAAVDGLWLLGGDQNLTIALLRDAEGIDSPLLAAMRERSALPHAEGGLVIGGTSAGAAVLSDPMIGGGSSFGALALPRASGAAGTEMSRALHVLGGFGLFPEGIVDQHFDTRARFARLAEAALVEDGASRLAFGIAEATALVYEGGSRRISVTGSGGLYIIDVRPAVRSTVETDSGPRTCIEGLLFHYLTEGDSFHATEERFDFGAKRRLSSDDPTFASGFPEASGVLSPYGSLADFAARMLLDNDPSLLFNDPVRGRRYARSLLVEDGPDSGGGSQPLGWEIRVGRALPGTNASPYREARLYYDGRYSFENVHIDILPVDIDIRRPL